MKSPSIYIWIWFCYFNSVRCYQVPASRRCNHYSSVGRVVGGKQASSGQWPWQAAVCIKYPEDSSWEFKCGGTLIKPKWVITAAHCSYEFGNANILVLFGVEDVGSSSPTKQVIHVNRYVEHPSYNSSTFYADISLLELKTDVKSSRYVQPAILPNSTTHFKRGHSCVVSGYGFTREGIEGEYVLNYAKIKIIPHHDCKSWYHESQRNVPDDHVCAGNESGGVDSCKGDSGGPLVCKKSHSDRTKYFLLGVTSFGEGCGRRHRPGVYTNVITYLDWIMKEVVAETSPVSQKSTSGLVWTTTASNRAARKSEQTTDDPFRSTTTSEESTRRSSQTTSGSEAGIASSLFALLAVSLLQHSVYLIY